MGIWRCPSSFGRCLDVAAQPCETFEDAFAGGSTARLHFPDVILSHDVEVECIGDVFGGHCYMRDIGQQTGCGRLCQGSLKQEEVYVLTSINVLLVGKNKQQRISHFTILNDARQFIPRLLYPVAVVAVNDKDEALGAGEVVAP